MLQKSLEMSLKEFKQALEDEKNAIEQKAIAQKQLKKFPVLNKTLFGGQGYELPKVPDKAPSLQDKKISLKKEEADDEFQGIDSTPAPIILDKSLDEILVSEADIVKAFYNIWVNLNYTLVTNWEKAALYLKTGIPFYKSAEEYREQLNSELGEAFKLLFSAKLENGSVFFKLVALFHYVTKAAVLEYESSSYITESLKKAGKASFNAIQFVFETIVKLEESRKLKVALEEKLALANNLSADEKIKLIRETQVNILRVFFGQKPSNESEPIFIIKEEQLIHYIENLSLIKAVISQYQIHAVSLDVEASSFLAFSTSSFIVSYTTKLRNTLRQLEDKIINLKKLDVPAPLLVNNQIEISKVDPVFSKPLEKQLIEENNPINLEKPRENKVISEEAVEVPLPVKVEKNQHEEKKAEVKENHYEEHQKAKVEKIELEEMKLVTSSPPVETVEKIVELKEPIVLVSEETKFDSLNSEKTITLHEKTSETISLFSEIKEEITFSDLILKESEVAQNEGIFRSIPVITTDPILPRLTLDENNLSFSNDTEPDLSLAKLLSEIKEAEENPSKSENHSPDIVEETELNNFQEIFVKIGETNSSNTNQDSSLDKSWVELSNNSSEPEQINKQNNTEQSISSPPPPSKIDESDDWDDRMTTTLSGNSSEKTSKLKKARSTLGKHDNSDEEEEKIYNMSIPKTRKDIKNFWDTHRLNDDDSSFSSGEDEPEKKPVTPISGDTIFVNQNTTSNKTEDPITEEPTSSGKWDNLSGQVVHFEFSDSDNENNDNTSFNSTNSLEKKTEAEAGDDKLQKHILPETIINVPLEKKIDQPEIHQEKTSPTFLEIALYGIILIGFTTIGATIGLAVGGIGGAMLGGFIGVMVSEIFILYLMDEKPVIDSYVEDQPHITKNDIDQTDTIQKNALNLNYDNIYTQENKKVTMPSNNTIQHNQQTLVVN